MEPGHHNVGSFGHGTSQGNGAHERQRNRANRSRVTGREGFTQTRAQNDNFREAQERGACEACSIRKKPCYKQYDIAGTDGGFERPCDYCIKMCGELRARVVCFSRKEGKLKKMMPLTLEKWNLEFAPILKSIEIRSGDRGSVTLEVQRGHGSHLVVDEVVVTFDGSSSTPIFDMNELMSIIDQVGKTVTILSHKEEETDEEVTDEESNFLEQASSCVGLFGFIQAFTHITYESRAREFGLGRIITTCLLNVLVEEYAKRTEELVMEVYSWLRAATRVRKRFDVAVVVLGVVSRLVREQCDLQSEGIWGCLKSQADEARATLEAFGAEALSLIDFDRPPSESFSDFANIVLPILPDCFGMEVRIQDTRSPDRESIRLGALLLYEAPSFGFSSTISEASLGSTVQPQTLEEYEAERRASETSPSVENSRGTNVHVASTDEYSNEAFEEVWNEFVGV